MADMPSTIVARNAPWQYTSILLCGVISGLAGLVILHTQVGPARWPGWACLLAAAMCLWSSLPRLLDSRPRLIVDARGVFDRDFGVGIIPWSDVLGAESFSVNGVEFIGLVLRNTSTWLQQSTASKRFFAAGNMQLGYRPFCICLKGINCKQQNVLAAIIGRLSADREARRVGPDQPA